MADYIDRQHCETAADYDEHYRLIVPLSKIRKFPSADVEPVVHGKWTSCFEDDRHQVEGDRCSICGFEHYGTPIGKFKFCPSCGAKMDGGESHD